MGGRLCLHLALACPDRVRALVLVGATPGIEDAAERAARAAADAELAARIERIGLEAFVDEWLRQPLFAGLGPEAACREERLEGTAAGLAASLRRMGTGAQEPLWGRLGELAMPVLILAGARDAKFAALGERMAAAIGPGATFASIPGAGHAAHLEQPAAVAARVRVWLGSV
jgi:2-succinyl-6-hydroxy-2,4-cyclohexadiene-1-carboxylate synthase